MSGAGTLTGRRGTLLRALSLVGAVALAALPLLHWAAHADDLSHSGDADCWLCKSLNAAIVEPPTSVDAAGPSMASTVEEAAEAHTRTPSPRDSRAPPVAVV